MKKQKTVKEAQRVFLTNEQIENFITTEKDFDLATMWITIIDSLALRTHNKLMEAVEWKINHNLLPHEKSNVVIEFPFEPPYILKVTKYKNDKFEIKNVDENIVLDCSDQTNKYAYSEAFKKKLSNFLLYYVKLLAQILTEVQMNLIAKQKTPLDKDISAQLVIRDLFSGSGDTNE